MHITLECKAQLGNSWEGNLKWKMSLILVTLKCLMQTRFCHQKVSMQRIIDNTMHCD